jgi:ribosomal protein L40E
MCRTRHCRQCIINNEDSAQCRGCGNRRSLLETKSDYIRNTLQNPSRRSSTSPLESLVMEGRAPRHSMPSLITSQSRINSIIDLSNTNPRNSVISANNGGASYASKPWVCQSCEAENSAMKIRCRECGEVNLGGTKRPESAAVPIDRAFYSV